MPSRKRVYLISKLHFFNCLYTYRKSNTEKFSLIGLFSRRCFLKNHRIMHFCPSSLHLSVDRVKNTLYHKKVTVNAVCTSSFACCQYYMLSIARYYLQAFCLSLGIRVIFRLFVSFIGVLYFLCFLLVFLSFSCA